VGEVLVKVGQDLKPGTRILQFTGGCSHPTIMKVRGVGRVEEVLVKVGQDLKPGTRILQFTGGCSHPTIMKVNKRTQKK
jgi:hypothetical protein